MASEVIISNMIGLLRHRGPDGVGLFVNRNIALAHTRLSIIDTSQLASQPMADRSGRFIISYNGEIYNYLELRKDLQNRGYNFFSASDTEVVLYALIEWGAEAVKTFNGMFALAFIDLQDKKILIARDRFGVKPLYYANENSTFCFASEIKSLLKNPNISKTLNQNVLYEYMTFQNIFSSSTFFKGINILEPGTYLQLNFAEQTSASLKIKKYWDWKFSNPNSSVDYSEYAHELTALFSRAVKRQLISDVPVGSYLSGGIDSASIAAIAARDIPGINTFTCGFALEGTTEHELGFDERNRAKTFSDMFKTTHQEYVIKPADFEESLESISWHLDEPRVGQSYPNYFAAKLASEKVKVVLSGAGGDELFGGYPWRYRAAINEQDSSSLEEIYFNYWRRMLSQEELDTLFLPLIREIDFERPRKIFNSILGLDNNEKLSKADAINVCLNFEAKTFLNGLLIVEDKISMAHSLETRVPFLDNDLVDFAQKCPVELKVNIETLGVSDKDGLQSGKKILRDGLKGVIGKRHAMLPKQGFSSPDASWFKNHSRKFILDRLSDKRSVVYDYLDFNQAQKILDSHFSGQSNKRLFIWSLLSVQQTIQRIMAT